MFQDIKNKIFKKHPDIGKPLNYVVTSGCMAETVSEFLSGTIIDVVNKNLYPYPENELFEFYVVEFSDNSKKEILAKSCFISEEDNILRVDK